MPRGRVTIDHEVTHLMRSMHQLKYHAQGDRWLMVDRWLLVLLCTLSNPAETTVGRLFTTELKSSIMPLSGQLSEDCSTPTYDAMLS